MPETKLLTYDKNQIPWSQFTHEAEFQLRLIDKDGSPGPWLTRREIREGRQPKLIKESA
jgi:hypothetical protein